MLRIDRKIKNLRHELHRFSRLANRAYVEKEWKLREQLLDSCYKVFSELNRLQRKRFAKLGGFLPTSNGRVAAFDPSEDRWLQYD